jgi:hypothetical protein
MGNVQFEVTNAPPGGSCPQSANEFADGPAGHRHGVSFKRHPFLFEGILNPAMNCKLQA